MSNNVKSSSGIGFLGLLALVFITLKLCNVITWSWWWVLSPLWGPFAFWIVFVMLSVLIAIVFIPFKKAFKKNS